MLSEEQILDIAEVKFEQKMYGAYNMFEPDVVLIQ